MGKRAPSSTTTTTTAALPDWQKPYQQNLFSAGQAAINAQTPQSTQSPYGTIAPQNQAQLTANAMLMGRGLSGSPLEDAGGGYLLNALNGGNENPYATQLNPMLGANPYLDTMAGNVGSSMAKAYAEGTAADRNTRNFRAGAFGSALQDQMRNNDEAAFSSSLGQTMTNLYGNEYNQQRGLFESALDRATGSYNTGLGLNAQMLGMLPMFQQMEMNNIGMIRDAGNDAYQYSQANLDALNDDYFNTQNFGWNQVMQGGDLLRMINGLGGGSTSTQSQGGSRNPYAMMLGGLGAGLLGGMMG